MEETVITPETAELAKNCGFDIETDKGYYKHGDEKDFVKLLLWVNIEDEKPEFGYAPTQSILQKWLREVHRIDVLVDVEYYLKGRRYICNIFSFKEDLILDGFNTYEESLELGLQEALKLISC